MISFNSRYALNKDKITDMFYNELPWSSIRKEVASILMWNYKHGRKDLFMCSRMDHTFSSCNSLTPPFPSLFHFSVISLVCISCEMGGLQISPKIATEAVPRLKNSPPNHLFLWIYGKIFQNTSKHSWLIHLNIKSHWHKVWALLHKGWIYLQGQDSRMPFLLA